MERHRCACSRPLPKTHHRQADQAAQNDLTWIAKALTGTKPMPARISREAADQPQSPSVTGTLARRVPYRRLGALSRGLASKRCGAQNIRYRPLRYAVAGRMLMLRWKRLVGGIVFGRDLAEPLVLLGPSG